MVFSRYPPSFYHGNLKARHTSPFFIKGMVWLSEQLSKKGHAHLLDRWDALALRGRSEIQRSLQDHMYKDKSLVVVPLSTITSV